MFKTVITAIALSAAAAPAFASDQLAYSVGVEPGVYSTATLIALDAAQKENDEFLIAQLLKKKIGAQVSRSAAFDGQLAASAGAKGANLSTNQLIELREAKRTADTNPERVAFIKAGGNDGATFNDRGVVTGGKVQLASRLNVNPADFTTNELVQMVANIRNSEDN